MTTPSAIALAMARRVQAEPHRVAARDQGRQLTFAELDALAGTLAARLVERTASGGLSRDAVLPIIVSRSVESVVAIHAAIRAGLPFSAVDDSTPPAMLADLLARLGGPRVGVVARPDRAVGLGRHVDWLPVPSTASDSIPPQPVDPQGRALVMFTSGSTGRPKGVLADWADLDLAGLFVGAPTEEDNPAFTVMTPTPFSFLAGLRRAWQLPVGPTLSIIDPAAVGPVDMLERVDREGVQILLATSSLASALADRWPGGRRLEHVTTVITGGEAMDWSHVPSLRALIAQDAVIVSKYGASEALGEAVVLRITPDQPLGTGPIPLGYVRVPGRARSEPVDPSDRNSPREIVVTGTIARGYLGEPDLTASRFGVYPDGTRFWRSGDIATVTPAGLYHRIGRIDDLVKIRGRLVEPSEPQRVLLSLDGIRSAVVLPHPTAHGSHRLVGHLQLEHDAALTAHDVRAHLSRAIAPHLVPAVLVRHDALPLTDRGKTDRQALLAAPPVPWRTAAPRPVVDEEERFACSAAAIALDFDDVQPDDDLWELGLDSLTAVELTVILEGAGWERLEPAMLLDHRTPAALARLHDDQPRPSQVVHLNCDGGRPPIFCIPGAGGTAMAYRWLATELGPDQPLVVIEPRGLHSPGRPDRTVAAAAGRALGLIEPLLPGGPVVLAGYSGGGVIAYEIALRLHRSGHEVRLLLLDAATGDGTRSRPPWPGALRAAKRASLRAWLRVFPASTVPREQRYRAYHLMGGRAALAYVPPKASFPITLFRPPTSPLAERWRSAVEHLDVIDVAGDHYTMLEPPHVSVLAEAIRPVLSDR